MTVMRIDAGDDLPNRALAAYHAMIESGREPSHWRVGRDVQHRLMREMRNERAPSVPFEETPWIGLRLELAALPAPPDLLELVAKRPGLKA